MPIIDIKPTTTVIRDWSKVATNVDLKPGDKTTISFLPNVPSECLPEGFVFVYLYSVNVKDKKEAAIECAVDGNEVGTHFLSPAPHNHCEIIFEVTGSIKYGEMNQIVLLNAGQSGLLIDTVEVFWVLRMK